MVGADGFEEAADQGVDLPFITTVGPLGPRVQTPWAPPVPASARYARESARARRAARLDADRRRVVGP